MPAPKQRNTDGEKADIKAGRIPQAWKDKPAKLARKDRDARWTVKFSKAKPSDDGSRLTDIAVPAFGYKNHIGIDRRHGLILTWNATHAARHDGAQLPNLARRPTPRAMYGPTRLIARRRTRRPSRRTACARRSTARSHRTGPCRRTSLARTAPDRKSGPRSSTSLLARKARWVSL